jgi:hypothetical protein
VDVGVNFFMCYWDDDGVLVTSRWKIGCEYLKGYFFIDFVSSIPFGLFTGGNSANKMLRILKLPRLVKMMKLTKLKKIKELYRGSHLEYLVRVNGGMINSLGLGVCTLLVIH